MDDLKRAEDTMLRRKGFHYSYYQAFVYALILTLFLLLGMVVLILYQLFHRPLPVFEAINTKQERMVLASFNEPNYLPGTLIRWASKAAVASYTFDFVNYNKQINNAAPFYTDAGWLDYKNSLARLISSITQKQLFVNSVVSGPPVIALQGLMAGKGYVWRIQLPFLVTYQSAETVSRENYFVVMTVVKVPTTLDPSGIGIDQFVMR
jgi:intracellular multiplication protein IcmL